MLYYYKQCVNIPSSKIFEYKQYILEYWNLIGRAVKVFDKI